MEGNIRPAQLFTLAVSQITRDTGTYLRTILPQMVLVLLATSGNFTGIALSTFAVDLFSESTHGFGYPELPRMILALGLLTMTGAHLALAGVLAKHWPHIAAFIGYSVPVLGGALTIAFTTMAVPATIEGDFRSTWERMYEHNRFRLYHIERAYGCCGFMNATDHAVPKICKKSPEFGYEEGCFQFLKHETQVQWARAFTWIMGVALAQVVLLGIGAFVYARADNGLHLDDEQEEYAPQDPERGWFVPERQAEREFLQQQQAGSITPTTDAPAVATLQVAVPGPSTQSPDTPQPSVIPTGLPAESQDAPPQKGNGIKLPEQIVRSSHGWIDHFTEVEQKRPRTLKGKQWWWKAGASGRSMLVQGSPQQQPEDGSGPSTQYENLAAEGLATYLRNSQYLADAADMRA